MIYITHLRANNEEKETNRRDVCDFMYESAEGVFYSKIHEFRSKTMLLLLRTTTPPRGIDARGRTLSVRAALFRCWYWRRRRLVGPVGRRRWNVSAVVAAAAAAAAFVERLCLLPRRYFGRIIVGFRFPCVFYGSRLGSPRLESNSRRRFFPSRTLVKRETRSFWYRRDRCGNLNQSSMRRLFVYSRRLRVGRGPR